MDKKQFSALNDQLKIMKLFDADMENKKYLLTISKTLKSLDSKLSDIKKSPDFELTELHKKLMATTKDLKKEIFAITSDKRRTESEIKEAMKKADKLFDDFIRYTNSADTEMAEMKRMVQTQLSELSNRKESVSVSKAYIENGYLMIAFSDGRVQNAGLVADDNIKGAILPRRGVAGKPGEDGRGIVSIIRTSGDGSPGTTDTYTITYTDATTSTFAVYNGADGTSGGGDMLKSVYDPTNVEGDAFDMDNMVESTTNKIFTATERLKLDGIEANANNYTHPANHPPSIITQDSSNRFVTDAEKTAWNGKANTVTYTGTLASASWTGSSAPYSQTIAVTGMASTDNAVTDVTLTGTYATDQAILTNYALVYRMVSGTNQVTAYANAIPAVDIPLQFKIVR